MCTNLTTNKLSREAPRKEQEHDYFECIGSGVKFQFFSTLFTFTRRMNMRVGAIDRYTLHIYGKIWNKRLGHLNFF